MTKISYKHAAMSICVNANTWADSKIYKRRLQGGHIEIVALRITRHSVYDWTLAIMDLSQSQNNNFYGYEDIITNNSHLSDVLEDIGLM